jgi:hypothetical protein
MRQINHARRVLLSIGAIGLITLGSTSTASASTLATFNTHGKYKWTVPSGVYKVTFDVFGASGGDVINANVLISGGGQGGEARGTFMVKPGQVFEVVIGGEGQTLNTAVSYSMPNGGFNGGGHGGMYGAGGGGASDIRIGGRTNSCASTMNCSIADRIVVGGGGGGGGTQAGGGAGGGANGVDTSVVGGDQENGLVNRDALNCYILNSGCFGLGGQYTDQYHGCGGGGGWFGGDSHYYINNPGGGGAGGSGLVGQLALKSSFPGGTHKGDGLVVIRTA